MLSGKKVKKLFNSYLPTLVKSEIAWYFPSLYDFMAFKSSFAALNITDNCCLKCVMCDQWKRKTDGELPTERWLEILAQLREVGIRDITLSGGEPFIRNDIIDIIYYASSVGLNVGVFTNGYLLDKEKIEEVVEAGVRSFSVSIDGVGESFDNIRGIKGAYRKVIDTCRMLSKYKNKGVDVYLYFTLMKPTLDTYREVFAIAEKFNFSFVVNLFDYTPYFFKDLKGTKDCFWVDENDLFLLRNFQQFMIEKKQNKPQSIYHTYNEIKYLDDYFKDPLQKNIPCIVSQQRIGIDSKGNVYGGCWSMGSFGNLKEKSLRSIMNSSRYRTAHKNMFFKKCPGCSCGYTKNLRYHLPHLIKELFFLISPATGRQIGSN